MTTKTVSIAEAALLSEIGFNNWDEVDATLLQGGKSEDYLQTSLGIISYQLWKVLDDFRRAERELSRSLNKVVNDSNTQLRYLHDGFLTDLGWVKQSYEAAEKAAKDREYSAQDARSISVVRNMILEGK